VTGKALSPEERKKCCQIVKPGTILGWFRQMAARKYDSSESKVGRPRKREDIRKLVVEMALANLGWGHTKIRDALRTGLKIEIGRTTVADILAEEGIEPAPEREKKRTWKQFRGEARPASHSDRSAVLAFDVHHLGRPGL
jgi:transposase